MTVWKKKEKNKKENSMDTLGEKTIKNNLFIDTCTDLYQDVKEQFRDHIPTQNSTFLLYTARGFFQNFFKTFLPEQYKYRHRQNLFSGYIDHIKNAKQVITVDFWTEIFLTFCPPRVASNTNLKIQNEKGVNATRFQPYDTETVYFPLVIYVCLLVLVLFFVTFFLMKFKQIHFFTENRNNVKVLEIGGEKTGLSI